MVQKPFASQKGQPDIRINVQFSSALKQRIQCVAPWKKNGYEPAISYFPHVRVVPVKTQMQRISVRTHRPCYVW